MSSTYTFNSTDPFYVESATSGYAKTSVLPVFLIENFSFGKAIRHDYSLNLLTIYIYQQGFFAVAVVIALYSIL
jgi:hypothetical protein